MLESCRRPDLVTEITLQPVRRYGVDAAIFFSDIVVPLKAVGVDLDIVPGVGPVVAAAGPHARRRRPAARPHARRRRPSSPRRCGCSTAELGATPLIGFAGAPFTLASYLVEGGPSKNHAHTKALMYGDPEVWHALCARSPGSPARTCGCRSQAGASRRAAVRLVGRRAQPRRLPASVLPHSATVLAAVADLGVPRIHFGVGTGELLALMGEAGADVVGVDYRVPLTDALARLGGRAVQGNLDPALVFAPWEALERRVREIVEAGRAAPGHIFNLGHGVLPDTDPDVLTRVVELVHEVSAR